MSTIASLSSLAQLILVKLMVWQIKLDIITPQYGYLRSDLKKRKQEMICNEDMLYLNYMPARMGSNYLITYFAAFAHDKDWPLPWQKNFCLKIFNLMENFWLVFLTANIFPTNNCTAQFDQYIMKLSFNYFDTVRLRPSLFLISHLWCFNFYVKKKEFPINRVVDTCKSDKSWGDSLIRIRKLCF